MSYLDRGDWKKVLDKKEHSSVKKTGISELLEGYEKAKKKGDNAALVLSLQEVREKAEAVKAKYAKLKTLTDYLDLMAKDAKVEIDRIKATLDDADDDDLEGADSTLAEVLAKVKTATDETRKYSFALAPSKVSTGLVVSKKATQRKHIKQAMDMRGKPGVYFQGGCFFDKGKYVFEFPEAPPAGMAKAIRQAARLHAEMGIKVIVRGGGVEFDDDSDSEYEEAGEVKAAGGGATKYPRRDAVDPIIAKVMLLPPANREDAISGAVGKFNMLRKQAQGDVDLTDAERPAVIAELDAALKKLHIAGEVPPTRTAFPTEADWMGLLDRCMRLDPEKRAAGFDAMRTKMREVLNQISASTTLTDKERQSELALLNKVMAAAKQKVPEFGNAAVNAGETGLLGRLNALETDFDQARKQGVLPAEIQTDLLQAIAAARKALANKDKSSGDLLDTLEAKIKAALSVAFEANSDKDRRKKQDALYNSVAPGVALIKKASFAPGMANMMFKNGNDLVMDDRLEAIANEFRACEKKPDPAALARLSSTAQSYLNDVTSTIDGLDPDAANYAASLKGLEAKAKAARDAVQRARLVELANKIEAVGAPPWDDVKTEQMTELQIAFFFEEGAVKQGAASFGAPTLSSDASGPAAGVNAAWWIKRAAKDGDRGDTERTYIFKPQVLEATSFNGIPDKGGSMREVMAATLSDALVGAGFDVGVCPTKLVEIDSAKLADLPIAAQGPARTLGAVQELAANDGPIVDAMNDDPEGFTKTVDHKNLSDIAVFDLMFLNLDRHAKNLLVKKGPDGKNKVIPIDHGIGMPDAEGLTLNRARLTGEQNVMNNDILRAGEPLAPETLANLKRLDARAMTADLLKKQQELEARHPDSAGKLDPTEYDRMASRIEFMQAAGDLMTAKEITQAIATYSSQINQTAKADMPRLAAALKAKMDGLAKASAEIAQYIPPDVDNKARFDLLMGLGWCVGLGYDAMVQWERENADLVLRILRAKIENPEARKEYDHLKATIPDEDLEKLDLKGRTMGKQVEMMRTKAAQLRNKARSKPFDDAAASDDTQKAFVNTPQAQQDLKDILAFRPKANLKTDKDKLNALRNWDVIKAHGGVAELPAARAAFPGNKADSLVAISALLAAWQEFQALGGMTEYLALGGQNISDATAEDRNIMFRELKRQRDSGNADRIRALDEGRIQASQNAQFDKMAKALYAQLPDVLRRERQKEFFAQHQEALADFKAGKVNLAQGKLDRLALSMSKQLPQDAIDEKQNKEKYDELGQAVAQAQKDRPDLDLARVSTALKSVAALIARRDLTPIDRALYRIELVLDGLLNGADSKYTAYQAELKTFETRATRTRTSVGGKLIDDMLAEAKAYLAAFDMKPYKPLIPKIRSMLVYTEQYQALAAKGQAWKAAPEVKSKFAAHLAKIEKLLAQGDSGGAQGLLMAGRKLFPDVITAEFG